MFTDAVSTDAGIARPPFDPEVEVALNEVLSQLPISSITPELIGQLRQMPLARTVGEMLEGRAISYEDRVVPGPVGEPDITLAIFKPKNTTGPGPGIYNTHGGGMIMGDRFFGTEAFFDLVEKDGVVVVSVEYRLAPEHPDPAPVEDCYAGLLWTAEHAEELGIDPARLLIAGASAGGGLAAGVALMARDRHGPTLVGQLLLCPMLDDRNETRSSHQYDGLGVWDRQSNETGWSALLGGRHKGPDVSPYAAPARATDLSGLPPAFIDVGSAEVFRDEDVAYATKIWEAGGRAELHVWSGGFHGFTLWAPLATVSVSAVEAMNSWLRRTLAL